MNIVVTVGKFSPPHTGHLALVEFLSQKAKELNAKAYIAPTESADKQTNPLTFKQKTKYITEMLKSFPNVELWGTITKSPYELIRDLSFDCSKTGGGTVTIFVGSDRLESFTKMAKTTLKKYQDRGECLNVEVNVVEAMNRDNDPKAYSATKMRQHVLDNNFDEFVKHVPFNNTTLAKEMFNDVKEGISGTEKPIVNHIELPREELRRITVKMAEEVSKHTNPVNNKTEKLYYVGGCVRDELLGKDPNDFDMVTTMYYQDFAKIFDTEDIRIRWGRYIVVPLIKGEPFETACLGRGQTIEDRLLASDITINAIAQDIVTGEYIDPLNGQEDIKNKILRATDVAISKLRKGGIPANVIRLFRFYSIFDWEIDYETMDAIQEFSDINKGKIKITEAQFNKDWNKLLKGKAKDKAIGLIKDFGFHDYLLKTQPLYKKYFEENK